MLLLTETSTDRKFHGLYNHMSTYACYNCNNKIVFYNMPPYICPNCFVRQDDISILMVDMYAKIKWHIREPKGFIPDNI